MIDISRKAVEIAARRIERECFHDEAMRLRALRDRVDEWEENTEVLLQKIPGAVRVREGGGYEDLIKSLCVSVLKLLR